MSGRKLRICELNAENLFISTDYYAGEDLERISEDGWRVLALPQLRRNQKPLAKCWGLAKAILDIEPDVLLLVEVGGRDSLEAFNRHFLADGFTPYFIEGNSRRNIDLGFLVRKGLPFRAEASSNRETPIEVHSFHGKYPARFSRDVAELRLFDPDGDRLALIFFLTHLKSKLSTELDPQGKDVRTAEAIALASIYDRARAAHPEVPIVLGGDFNAELSSLELELLKRTDLTDFHDRLGTPREDRITFLHFAQAGKAEPMVLDHLLVSPHLRDRIDAARSFTYRYKGFHDIPEELPRNLRERMRLPSDHYPVVLTVELP